MKRTLILVAVMVFALAATAYAAPSAAMLTATDDQGKSGYAALGVGHSSGMGGDFKITLPPPPLGDYVRLVIVEESAEWSNYILNAGGQEYFNFTLNTIGASIQAVQVNIWEPLAEFTFGWPGLTMLTVTADPEGNYTPGHVLWSGDIAGSTAGAPIVVHLADTWTGTDPLQMQFGPIPEPGSMLAMFTGLVGLAGFAIRRRK